MRSSPKSLFQTFEWKPAADDFCCNKNLPNSTKTPVKYAAFTEAQTLFFPPHFFRKSPFKCFKSGLSKVHEVNVYETFVSIKNNFKKRHFFGKLKTHWIGFHSYMDVKKNKTFLTYNERRMKSTKRITVSDKRFSARAAVPRRDSDWKMPTLGM